MANTVIRDFKVIQKFYLARSKSNNEYIFERKWDSSGSLHAEWSKTRFKYLRLLQTRK